MPGSTMTTEKPAALEMTAKRGRCADGGPSSWPFPLHRSARVDPRQPALGLQRGAAAVYYDAAGKLLLGRPGCIHPA